MAAVVDAACGVPDVDFEDACVVPDVAVVMATDGLAEVDEDWALSEPTYDSSSGMKEYTQSKPLDHAL